jgi:hypothetical protein
MKVGLLSSYQLTQEGSFAPSYPLSLWRVDGIADTAGKKGPPPLLIFLREGEAAIVWNKFLGNRFGRAWE